jgi:hypothetical protein
LDSLAKRNVSAAPKPAKPSIESPKIVAQASQPVSERGVDYTLLGQPRHAKSATDALIDILRSLAQRDAHFAEKLAPTVRGRTRNHISDQRDQVYPGKPDLFEYTVEFIPGWWLGTNIANREKIRIIKSACTVAKLSFGKDVVMSLPNAV